MKNNYFYLTTLFLCFTTIILAQNSDIKKHQKEIEKSKKKNSLIVSLDTVFISGQATYFIRKPKAEGINYQLKDNGNKTAIYITESMKVMGHITYVVKFPTTTQQLSIFYRGDVYDLLSFFYENNVFEKNSINKNAVNLLSGKHQAVVYNNVMYIEPQLKLSESEKQVIIAAGTLKNKKVKDIQLDIETFGLKTEPVIMNNFPYKIGITAVFENGTKSTTGGDEFSQTPWRDYNITVDGGEFKLIDNKTDYLKEYGVIYVADPRQTKKHKVTITVSSVYDVSVKKEIVWDLNYDKGVNLNYSAQSAYSQYDVLSKFSEFENKQGVGKNGRNGQSSYDGLDAEDVEVYISAYKDPILQKELLKIYSKTASGREVRTVVSPSTGSVVISANGGDGANGQSGQDGSKGLIGGNGGDGGDGGNGGSGGKITIHLDPTALKHKSAITYKNYGGLGGKGGSGGYGGDAKNTNQYKGNRGNDGRYGKNGKPGPLPIIKNEAVTLDW